MIPNANFVWENAGKTPWEGGNPLRINPVFDPLYHLGFYGGIIIPLLKGLQQWG